jgi:hypothetical protein
LQLLASIQPILQFAQAFLRHGLLFACDLSVALAFT